MRVTKFGHACLLVEEAGAKILIDPGQWSVIPALSGVDAVLITHEHFDHCHPAFIKEVLAGNPAATVYTHEDAGKVLAEAGIPFSLIHEGDEVSVKGVSVSVHGSRHAKIYGDFPDCQNVGYLVAGRFFYPGDKLGTEVSDVEILALPVGGPWLKLAESIDYAKALKPKVVIPVHDAFFMEGRAATTRSIPKKELETVGVEFRDMDEGSVEEF